MNPFEVHGIEHLSPSSCNLFASEPAMFVMNKVLKYPNVVGAAAFRGTAVESGIAHGLMNPAASIEECIEIAKDQFAKLVALSGDPRADKEAAAIADMVRIGLAELRPYGVPTDTQGKIEYQVEGLAVPLIGFYDFIWEDKGILTDLKTSHALTSSIKPAHAKQVALYRAAKGGALDTRVTYVTSKKCATYTLENPQEHLEALIRIAMTIQRFLSVSDDPKALAGLVVPDTESFYYNDGATRQAAFEVWGV